jgi:hypothetical protein
MNFEQALKEMKQGKKVKLPNWEGYWQWENDSIKMYCKDGRVLDIRKMEDVGYTMSNIVSDEWVIAGENDTRILKEKQILAITLNEDLPELFLRYYAYACDLENKLEAIKEIIDMKL